MLILNVKTITALHKHIEQNCHITTTMTGSDVAVWPHILLTLVSMLIPNNWHQCILHFHKLLYFSVNLCQQTNLLRRRKNKHLKDERTQPSTSCELSKVWAESQRWSENHLMLTCLLLFLIPLILPCFPRQDKSMRFGWFIHRVMFGPGWPAVTHCPLLQHTSGQSHIHVTEEVDLHFT